MIEIKNLTKSFDGKIVLEEINLTISKGSIFGLIGINGAGKSTLMRIMTTVYKPDSGEVLFEGISLFESKEIKKKVFFLPDEPYYSLNASVKSLLQLYQSFYKDFDKDKFYYYMDKFALDPNKKIMNYSKGMKRRFFICIALACKVEYIILDEAFDGLDPLARIEFKNMITDIYEEYEDMTIILSSHSLKDLEDIVDSFAILDNKKVISSGNTNNQIEQYIKYQLAFKENKVQQDFDFLKPILVSIDNKIIELVFKKEETISYLEELQKMSPVFIEEIPISFEDYFTTIIKESGYIK
ncbi:MAG: ABC transporter ATP-binding protein [Roseburia sp.]|nr:ABC transporter ATP-binding protein [Anaeroplasma bactoclasticum]MCM1196000.1 ABC transporter ATP-binding protein [Roseburia sp.]MCM1556830.1 ABC transporter ATP-binding protein [Anaeroplasma bactoclasticum]